MKQRVPMIVAVANLLLCVAYILDSRQYPVLINRIPGPGLFPLTIGLFWLGVSLWTIVEVWGEDSSVALSTEWTDREGWVRIAVILVTAGLFIGLLDTLGDLVVSILSIMAVMRAMGTKSVVRIVGTSVAMAFAFHFLFVNQLGVPLPQGFWNE